MKPISYVLLVQITVVMSVNEKSYCGAPMCSRTNAHTFCKYAAGPSPDCLGYMRSRLSPQEKVAIVTRVNRRRNDAASGMLRGLPSAANMMRVHWVEELALGAQRWADQCRIPRNPEENDACRDLFAISVGQTVASVVGDAPGLLVETLVDIWFLQNLEYKGLATSFIPPPANSSFYGDFAQLTWSRTYLIGCGRSRFMSTIGGRLRSVIRLVCNFAPRGPAYYHSMWTPGIPASLCPNQAVQDPELPNLCDFYVQEGEDMYYYKKFLEKDEATKTNKTVIKKSKKYRRSNRMTTIQLIGRPKSYDIEDLLGSADNFEDDNNLDDSSTTRASTELADYESPADDSSMPHHSSILHASSLTHVNSTIQKLTTLSNDYITTKVGKKNTVKQMIENKIALDEEELTFANIEAIMKLIQKRMFELNGTEINPDMLLEKIMDMLKSTDRNSVEHTQKQPQITNSTSRAGKVRRELNAAYETTKALTTTKDANVVSNTTKGVTEYTDANTKPDNVSITTTIINTDVVVEEGLIKKNISEYDDYEDEDDEKKALRPAPEDDEDDEAHGGTTESTIGLILRFMPQFYRGRIQNSTAVSLRSNNRAMLISPAFILLLTCVL